MTSSSPTLIFNQQTSENTIRVWQQDERRWLEFDDGLYHSIEC